MDGLTGKRLGHVFRLMNNMKDSRNQLQPSSAYAKKPILHDELSGSNHVKRRGSCNVHRNFVFIYGYEDY